MLLLLAVHVLLGSGCRVVEPDYAAADRYYTAIARIPEFFTEQSCDDDRAARIDVYATRSASSRIGEIRWGKAGVAREHYCLPLFFANRGNCPRGVLPLLEEGYEERAFVVVARSGEWVLIRLDRGSGWIRLTKDSRVVPYDELVINRIAELTKAWDGRIYAKPGGRSRSFVHSQSRQVTVIESRRAGGELWFRIRLLAVGPCDAREPLVAATGWVRGYSQKLQATVRHFSRGC